jgi:hypothetical protein
LDKNRPSFVGERLDAATVAWSDGLTKVTHHPIDARQQAAMVMVAKGA